MLAIHNDPSASQHKIARLTHLSSSMVNNYIKELQRAGRLSVSGKTNRTQSYHLTESGQSELMSMLMTYSAEIVQLYTSAKHEITERLNHLYDEGIRKVALYGAAETGEVVHTALKETPLSMIAVVDGDPKRHGKRFNGLRVEAPERLKDKDADAVVITSFAKQEEIHRCIRKITGDEVKIKKLSDL